MKPLGEKPKIPFPPLKFDISANRFLEEGKIYNQDFLLFGGGDEFLRSMMRPVRGGLFAQRFTPPLIDSIGNSRPVKV